MYSVSIFKTSSSPSLRRALNQMIVSDLVDAANPSHAIVFVGTINQNIVMDCLDLMQVQVLNSRSYLNMFKKINQANGVVTFVTLGSDVDVNLLKQLSPNVITWDIDNQNMPDNWEQQLWTAYGCSKF